MAAQRTGMTPMDIESGADVADDIKVIRNNPAYSSPSNFVTSQISRLQTNIRNLVRTQKNLVYVGSGIVFMVIAMTIVANLRTIDNSGSSLFLPLKLEGNALTFFSIGDFGRQGTNNQDQVAYRMGIYGEQLNPRFVISVGDNFYEAGVETVMDPQFNTSFAHIYTAPSLQIPWFPILGNHDYRNSLQAQIQYSTIDSRWQMKDLNYSLQYNLPPPSSSASTMNSNGNSKDNDDCLSLIFTDTCPFIREYYEPNHWDDQYPQFAKNILASHPQEQLVWLEEQLRQAYGTCKAIMVIGHHPVYTAGIHGDSKELVDQFKPLLDRYGVDSYVAGHDHTMVHLRKDNIDYIITGAGSRVRSNNIITPETVWIGDVPGFTIHSVNSTHTLTSFIHANGDILHQSFHPLRTKNI